MITRNLLGGTVPLPSQNLLAGDGSSNRMMNQLVSKPRARKTRIKRSGIFFPKNAFVAMRGTEFCVFFINNNTCKDDLSFSMHIYIVNHIHIEAAKNNERMRDSAPPRQWTNWELISRHPLCPTIRWTD